MAENQNQIHLTVQTLSGNYSDRFNIHQKLQHVIDNTFEHLHIQPAPGEIWILRYGDRVLDPKQTIEEAGLPDKAVLKLAVKEGGGGAKWIRK